MKNMQLIAGDASDRKFFRFDDGSTQAICMQFPKWEGGYGGDPMSWIGMHAALVTMGIPVPQILKIDEKEACIWTEDLGDKFLNATNTEKILDKNNPNCTTSINGYKKALDLLILAQYPHSRVEHPATQRFFDHEKLFFELNFFITHFLNNTLQLQIDANNSADLFAELNLLSTKLAACERVLCHRDYHVRNIMLKNETLYWIDFQDARMGPHTYDVVSLVRDSYTLITWETRAELFEYYLTKLSSTRSKNRLIKIQPEDFYTELLLMGLQRNIKAIGSFGYLYAQKNKSSYLQYIQPTLDILMAPEAQVHSKFNIKTIFPKLFTLLERIHSGDLASTFQAIVQRRA